MINNTITKDDWVWNAKEWTWEFRSDVVLRDDTIIGFVPDENTPIPVTQAECDAIRARARVEQDKLLAEAFAKKLRGSSFDGKTDTVRLS